MRIINAGFRVFAQNCYRKAPVGEIAAEAGISKSLLFHYFRNKKEFYFFLWEKAEEISSQSLTEYGCYEPEDLFDAMERGLYAKMKIMEDYPHLGEFVIRSFYEKDPEVTEDIQRLYASIRANAGLNKLKNIDFSRFRDGLDLSMMFREMYLASEGYLWELLQRNEPLDGKKLEQDFKALLAFWKSVYYK